LMARLHLACMFPNMVLTQTYGGKLAARLLLSGRRCRIVATEPYNGAICLYAPL